MKAPKIRHFFYTEPEFKIRFKKVTNLKKLTEQKTNAFLF